MEPLLLHAESGPVRWLRHLVKMPPRGKVRWQTWDTLERLYLMAGLGTPEKLVEVAGEGSLWVSLQLEVNCVLNHPDTTSRTLNSVCAIS